jgi:hypothetical protein
LGGRVDGVVDGVHLQRDDDDTPTDGYGGNSSRFIEAYLGMDER